MRRRVFHILPQMPALQRPGVPALTDPTPDADVVGEASLSIEPAQPYRWVTSPGQDFVLNIKARTRNGSDGAVLTLWDWENRPVAQTRFSLPCEAKVTIRPECRGTYVVTLDAVRGDECLMRLVRSFSICPPNQDRRSLWRKSGFWIGQCSFPGWHNLEIRGHTVHPPGLSADESVDLEAELVSRMGVGVARINLPVARRDDGGMDLDFSAADKCVRAYSGRGIPLDLQLFGAYGEGLGPVLDKYANIQPTAVYPLKEKPYRYFIRQTAGRYGKDGAFFQIGNEPGNAHQYGGTADEYLDQLKQAADEIRRLKTGLPVTNGGYCFTNADTQHIIAGARGLTDFVSYHWHGDLAGLIGFRNEIRKLHEGAGYQAARYANTEMGYAMPTVGRERANAMIEMQKLLYCWAHGDLGVLLYSSREIWWPRQYSYNGVSDYGFVDYFFCPRFVYGAVSAFIDRYAGFRFERVLRESDKVHVYEFRSGDKRMIAAFAPAQPVEMGLRSDAEKAALIDAMGNETKVDSAESVRLTAGEYPQAVLLEGASRVELAD